MVFRQPYSTCYSLFCNGKFEEKLDPKQSPRIQLNPLTPRVKPCVIQSLSFDCMGKILTCDHSLESCYRTVPWIFCRRGQTSLTFPIYLQETVFLTGAIATPMLLPPPPPVFPRLCTALLLSRVKGLIE